MTDTGWYPDPGGRSGHFRYWDGQRWSDQTTTNPQDPAPAAPAEVLDTTRGDGRSSRALWLVLAAVVAVVLVIFLVVRTFLGGGEIGDPRPPRSTVSAWDETSTPDAGPENPAEETPSGEMQCPAGDPYDRTSSSTEGRVHGGGISFAEVGNGYGRPSTELMLSWMDDTQSQEQITEPGWISVFAVGSVQSQPYFDSVQGAAQSSMECGITNGWYSGFTGREDLKNEATQVDGHDAWIVESEIRVDKPGLSVEGDLLTFLAVDTGQDSYAVFMGMVPIGDEPRTAIYADVLDSLTVD